MKCPNCGREIANNSLYCEFCGAQIKKPHNYKWLWIALIVFLFFAVLGGVIYYEYTLRQSLIEELHNAQAQTKQDNAEDSIDISVQKMDSFENKVSQSTPTSEPEPKEKPSPAEYYPTQTEEQINALLSGLTFAEESEPDEQHYDIVEAAPSRADASAPVSTSSTNKNYNLPGRELKGTLPQPSSGFDEEGTVVVQVRVDAEGNVIYAQPVGGTVYSRQTINLALEAARKAKFTRGSGEQVGEITYKFMFY